MIAKVAFPASIPGIFDYKIPVRYFSLIIPGVPVKVELRKRSIWGVVVSVGMTSSFPKLKEILEVKSEKWRDSCSSLISLYEWVAEYYQSDLGKVFKPLIRRRIADLAPKTITVYSFSGAVPDSLTTKQKATASSLNKLKGSISKNDLINNFGISDYMFSVLKRRKVLLPSLKEVLRQPGELDKDISKGPVKLTGEQRKAITAIWDTRKSQQKPFLLYGVTGSGKTHVYIELVKKTLKEGKGVILLVPEISLTPQTIQRFRDAIDSEIAVIHSRMSDGERRDSVEELVSGRKQIVVGVRSAILVPLNNVGLIVVDEEHDSSYKQSDPEPRYNARDVAVMRGYFQKATVVMGSATPSFESYFNALQEKYTLVKLTKRYGRAALPNVKTVDMNREHQQNNWTFLSRYLKNKIQEALDQQRQVILLLNRRGFAVSLICKKCGHIYKCLNCSVNLIYHRPSMHLKCHQCGYDEPAPSACAQCGGEQIKYRGTGIQKVEDFLTMIFPQARILRMDQDTTRRKGSHVSILGAFAKGEADILLGTQMVAKGLNFPGVKLVGVLQADTGLHFPDFRASEKTFQLLSQVAGRAGRKDSLGEVIIQTYSPKEPSIVAAQKHDFQDFYQKEIDTRQSLKYPPFSRLIRIILQGEDEGAVKSYMLKVAKTIRQQQKHLLVLGPSPAVLTRLKRYFRYTLLLKSKYPRKTQKILLNVRTKFNTLPKGIKLIIDVDPINML